MQLQVGSWQELGVPATQIRFAVFVDEQGIPRNEELDHLDDLCIHAVVFCDQIPAATGRLCPDGRIGRMAVLKSERGRSLGKMVMNALLDAAKKQGISRVYLHAQCHALGFYEKFGFTAYGPGFKEAGIDHRQMQLWLGKL